MPQTATYNFANLCTQFKSKFKPNKCKFEYVLHILVIKYKASYLTSWYETHDFIQTTDSN